MNAKERAKTDMFDALKSVLEEYAEVYKNDVDYCETVTGFLAAYKANQIAASETFGNTKGFKEEKVKAKKELAFLAATLAGKAHVKLKKLGHLELTAKLITGPSIYEQAAGIECQGKASVLHKLLKDNLDLLSPNSITEQDLAKLQAAIDNFQDKNVDNTMAVAQLPINTQLYKKSFKPVMDRVRDLKLLTRDYRETNRDFHNNVMRCIKPPKVHVRHTSLHVTVLSKETSKPITGAIVSLQKRQRTATTDRDGLAKIERVRFCHDMLTCIVDGKVIFHQEVKIKRGKRTVVEVRG